MTTATRRQPKTKRRRGAPPARKVSYPINGVATIAEACEFLRVAKSTVYDLVRSQRLRTSPVCREIRIPWSALHELVGDRTPQTA